MVREGGGKYKNMKYISSIVKSIYKGKGFYVVSTKK